MNTEQNSDATPAAMTPRDWFTIILRAFGVWELLNTCDQAITVLNINAGIWKPLHTEMGSYVTHALETFLIGIWLLKGAPAISQLFYPAKPAKTNDSN